MPPRESAATTATGAALEGILEELKHIKSSKEINDMLSKEIKSVVEKVNDHDKSLIMIAKAMEDMNENFHEFTTTVKEIQKDSNEFQKTNQVIMMELKQVVVAMSKYEPRFEKIEERQLNGCPNFNRFEDKRNTELKHWEDVKQTLLTATGKNREETNELREISKVSVEQIKVANNRIADLETITTKLGENFNTWKESMYKALITYAIGIIGAIIAGIWGLVTK
jgi:DNA repair exonuclease SbcCD ATPase subunit